MYGDEAYIIGNIKRKLGRYQEITRKLVNKEELTGEEKEQLIKDGIRTK
ncbi:hypothetical protein L0Y65_06970 [Candidatus Micrarchaeota archaeon]|nr:hypothetical protein [Candidatus Micrarchaeota archaeon]